MAMLLIAIFILFKFCYISANELNRDLTLYNIQREAIIAKERSTSFQADVFLSKHEELINEYLMEKKWKLLNGSVEDGKIFDITTHYFNYYNRIKDTELYDIIKRMPKGGLLHVHSTAFLGPEFYLNLTYMDNLYICRDGDSVQFHFSKQIPINVECKASWILFSQLRRNLRDAQEFDSLLRQYFTVFSQEFSEMQSNEDKLWGKFDKLFGVVGSLLSFREVWQQYVIAFLSKCRDDGLMYIEFRSSLKELYDLDGTTYNKTYFAKFTKDIIDDFVRENDNFIGAKMIYAKNRNIENANSLIKELQTVLEIQKQVPNFIVGFDLVSREDTGRPLIDFVDILLPAQKFVNYVFHAGETKRFGSEADNNLVDAVLLGSKRLGHGFSIIKHPVLMEMIKEKGIAVEINVVSNIVLGLVDSPSNHPLSVLLANDVPTVICSDDPGMWEAEPISFDYFVAFLGSTRRDDDLRTLKKWVWNSIEYSSLNKNSKAIAYHKLERQWNEFIYSIISELR